MMHTQMSGTAGEQIVLLRDLPSGRGPITVTIHSNTSSSWNIKLELNDATGTGDINMYPVGVMEKGCPFDQIGTNVSGTTTRIIAKLAADFTGDVHYEVSTFAFNLDVLHADGATRQNANTAYGTFDPRHRFPSKDVRYFDYTTQSAYDAMTDRNASMLYLIPE